ncbi:DUF523 domain-containing protein [Brevibacillus sp. SYSU BS000544]|uniref:DUF523 domain-containing protein n=1 Tax=Brevibacillus sp. SYSU BS000544 TaxID=3416443 RepID=UPI003CE54E4E
MLAVSACLAGFPCRYDHKSCTEVEIAQIVQTSQAIPLCPEQLAGLPTPRDPAEIVGGDGFDVLEKRAKVIDSEGHDVTEIYVKGAYEALAFCQERGITSVVLKDGSPTCGSQQIYDGTFSGRKIPGAGVATALLVQNGIQVNGKG